VNHTHCLLLDVI